MAGYRRMYGKRSNSYFKNKRSCRPTKKLAKFVSNVVARSTSTTVRRVRTDPPAIKLDRPFKRLVRIQIPDDTTNINANLISTTEASYYASGEAVRWQTVKILAATFYGQQDQPIISITQSANGNIAATTFTDVGDLNHRPAIKLIMPPTMVADAANATTTRFSFPAGTLEFVDVYVEFC